MDYRIYGNKLSEIKNNIVKFLAERNNKALTYADNIVDSYLESLQKGDISIKSFKLKVIHSEQTYKKNNIELIELLKTFFEEFKVSISQSYEDYEKNISYYKYNYTRKNDLLIKNGYLKRKRQDAFIRINSLEKDLLTKEKEKNNHVAEKNKIHSQNTAEINRRLLIDLQRSSETCIKEYLPIERNLLDIDNYKEITESKEKIKNIRSANLDRQYELKIKSYKNMQNDEKSTLEETKKLNLDFEILKRETEKKILESKKSIQLFQVEEQRNAFEYDFEKEEEALKKYEMLTCEYLEIVGAINQDLLLESENRLSEKLLQEKCLKIILEFLRLNLFDPTIKVTSEIYDAFKEIIASYNKKEEENKKLLKEKYDLILDKIDDFDDATFKNKKTTKDDFMSIIDGLLANLYCDSHFEIQKKSLIEFVSKIIDVIIILTEEIDKTSVKIDNIILEKEFINSDVIDEKLCLINDKIKKIKADSNEFHRLFLKNKQLERQKFNILEKKKIQKIEKTFINNCNNLNKDIKKVSLLSDKQYNSDIHRINNEYKKNCHEAKMTLLDSRKIL